MSTALSAVVLVVGGIVTGWLATRFLGVRARWVHVLVAGVVGLLVGVVFAETALADTDVSDIDYVVAALGAATVAAMVVGVGLDAFARPGTVPAAEQLGRIGALPHPVRRVRRMAAPLGRFREVLGIARRHGLLRMAEEWRGGRADEVEVARRLRATLEDAGGMFVKLGQVASTRADLLPPPVIEELTQLQADVAPEASDAVRAVLVEELGAQPEELFAEFDWAPLASASIAQVHRARLGSGDRVVVKVQRRDVGEAVRRDCDALFALARFVDRRTSLGLRFDVVGLAAEFVAGLREELDFRLEAGNIAAISAHADQDHVVIPAVHQDLSTRRVLVLDEIEGVSVADRAAVAAELEGGGETATDLARWLLEAALQQMFRDGVFHADLHPGNVFVTTTGQLGLLDFGAVGVLDHRLLEGLRLMLVAAALSDPVLLRRAVLEVTGVPDTLDLARLDADLGRFLVTNLRSSRTMDAQLFREMVAVLERNGLEVPNGLTLLTRALVTMEGTLGVIDPRFAFSDEVERVVRTWAQPEQPEATTDELVRAEVIRALPTLRTLPEELERLSLLVRTGTLTARVRLTGHPDDARAARRGFGWALLALIGTGGLGASSLLLVAAGLAPADGNLEPVLTTLGFVGLFAGAALILRVLAAMFREAEI